MVRQLYSTDYEKGSVLRLLTRQLYSPVYSTYVHTAAPDTAPEEAPWPVSPKNNTDYMKWFLNQIKRFWEQRYLKTKSRFEMDR